MSQAPKKKRVHRPRAGWQIHKAPDGHVMRKRVYFPGAPTSAAGTSMTSRQREASVVGMIRRGSSSAIRPPGVMLHNHANVAGGGVQGLGAHRDRGYQRTPPDLVQQGAAAAPQRIRGLCCLCWLSWLCFGRIGLGRLWLACWLVCWLACLLRAGCAGCASGASASGASGAFAAWLVGWLAGWLVRSSKRFSRSARIRAARLQDQPRLPCHSR